MKMTFGKMTFQMSSSLRLMVLGRSQGRSHQTSPPPHRGAAANAAFDPPPKKSKSNNSDETKTRKTTTAAANVHTRKKKNQKTLNSFHARTKLYNSDPRVHTNLDEPSRTPTAPSVNLRGKTSTRQKGDERSSFEKEIIIIIINEQ